MPLAIFALIVCILGIFGCKQQLQAPAESYTETLREALTTIGLDEEAMSVPKLGFPYSTPGRIQAVDTAMKRPTAMIGLTQRLSQAGKDATPPSLYLSRLLGVLEVDVNSPSPDSFTYPNADNAWSALSRTIQNGKKSATPVEWKKDEPLYRALRLLLLEIALAQQSVRTAIGDIAEDELSPLRDHLLGAIHYQGPTRKERWLIPDGYHALGVRVRMDMLAGLLIRLLAVVEQALPDLRQGMPASSLTHPLDWETPLGRVRLAGTGNDRHSGEFLLLIDLGGDDVYIDIGSEVHPGTVSIVIDLAGNDTVHWERKPGPGAGVFGVSLWADMQGNDRYAGRNLGLGAGLFGAGLLWDAEGDDVYQGGSMTQGAAGYGIGILLDSQGNDQYGADLNGQGFGGPGGIGILADLAGNDAYTCGGRVPDQSPERSQRHDALHYISMCQGYAFGIRPKASGGVGVLLDHEGNDVYEADLFAQGGAYWFGLGILADGNGDDRYRAFEHCQGASLHLGAGVLADWGGNDEYEAFEHCQGVGMDRAAGVLYDHAGNDRYRADRESQGTGLKPHGVGLLIEMAGDDRYEAATAAQGYSVKPEGFPDEQWPIGVLLDLQGADDFRLPSSGLVGRRGRIQNRQGIALDR